MGDEKKVQFTNAARERLDRALSEYRGEIEAYITERKFLPGEEVIEATASDVEKAIQDILIRPRRGTYPTLQDILIRPRRGTYPTLLLVARVYVIVGALLTIVGASYMIGRSWLVGALSENPVGVMLVTLGVLLFLSGISVPFLVRWWETLSRR